MRAAIAIAIISFVIGYATSALADQFCQGFERGYTVGYKRASGSALDPLPPMCPMQPMKGFNDPASDFEHGYIIGFEKGMAEGRRR